MRTWTTLVSLTALALVAFVPTDALSDDTREVGGGGTAAVYGPVLPDQIELLSTQARILDSVTSGSVSSIWEALERGERVECVACVNAVEPLLYADNPEVREIAAWWLRRRIHGVFGPGEVYERVTLKLRDEKGDPRTRAYAASALGEFLAPPGVAECTAILLSSVTPARVRAAAASALGRLNDEGPSQTGRTGLGAAIADADASVAKAGLHAAARLHVFTSVASIESALAHADAPVRRVAVRTAESRGFVASVASLRRLLTSDPDADVRAAAAHALGAFRAKDARDDLSRVGQSDVNSLVRDQALIALRRI